MSDIPGNMIVDHAELSFMDRVASWLSWAVAVVLFITIGWFAMEPDDPLGAVSVLTRNNAIAMFGQTAALTAIVAGIATVVIGRKLVDAGTFAAALGLIAVSLRGDTAEYLLVQSAEAGVGPRGLALKFAAESVGWFVVVLTAPVVSFIVARWMDNGIAASVGQNHGERAALDATMIGHDAVELVASGVGRVTASVNGVKHAVLTVIVGFAAFHVFSTGLSARMIQHGQSCFVFSAAVGVGCYFAHRIVPVRSALWSFVAVGALTVLGLIWASVWPGEANLPANIPASPFLRILPIQYVSVGTATAIFMRWYMDTPHAAVADSHRGVGHAIAEGRV